MVFSMYPFVLKYNNNIIYSTHPKSWNRGDKIWGFTRVWVELPPLTENAVSIFKNFFPVFRKFIRREDMFYFAYKNYQR